MNEIGPVTSLQPDVPEPATGATPRSAEATHVDQSDDFRKLDRRIVTMWTITALIGSGTLLLAGIVGGGALWLFAGYSPLIVIPVWLLLGLNFFLETRWLPRRRYAATGYRMGNGFFEFRSGLLWKTSVMIPISRLQHVDLLRGPWEQHYGLATLDLHTAGTQKASQKIPGLELGTAISIREELVAAAQLESDDAREETGKE